MKKNIKEIVNKDIETLLYFENIDLYPDGKGGQLGDRGYIEDEKFKTIKKEKIYLSIKNSSNFHLNQEVEIKIDLNWKKDISIQHTAQHILSAVIFDEFSGNTVGFQMGEKYSTIDIDIPSISEKMIDFMISKTNKVIRSNLYIKENYVEKNELEKYHLRKPVNQKVLNKDEKIRIISIGDFDHSACGGYHVKQTGDIGCLSIVKTEKVKGNLTRLFFLAGQRAVEYFSKINSLKKNLKKLLTCDENNIFDRVNSLLDENKLQRNKYKKILSEMIIKDLEGIKDEVIFIENENEYLNTFSSLIQRDKYLFIGKNNDTFYLSSKGYNCKKLVDLLKKEFDIKGGAGPIKGQVKSSNLDQESLKKFISYNLEEVSG